MSEHRNPYETDKPKCKGCIYAGALMCEYILITGKSPQSQGAHIDPDGDGGCELYEKGKKKTIPRENVFVTYERKRKLDVPETMELYKAGASDLEIANKMKAAQTSVFEWRKRHKLPPNYQRGERSDKHARYYIYLRASGELIAHGTAWECAKKLRFSGANQVYKLYRRSKDGKSEKYEVIKREAVNDG